jgi:hypothetical protein
MPEMTIQLRCDPATGKRDIVVKLHDDEELLPVEHEQLHRKLVDRLIEGGLIKAGEGGRLIVEREGQGGVAPSPVEAEPTKRAVGESQ